MAHNPHRRRTAAVLLAFGAALSAGHAARAQSAEGQAASGAEACNQFVGTVQAQWIDGRKMRLTAPFAFVDPGCKRWEVPTGVSVDGASIPQAFWSIIGGPFEGAYRQASVIHDYYCVKRNRSWRSVHRMFYDGMLAAGTDPIKAKIMYYAVLVGGPRWKQVTYSNHPPRMVAGPGDTDIEKTVVYSGRIDDQLAQQTIERIERQNLSVDQIETMAAAQFAGEVPPDVVRTDR